MLKKRREHRARCRKTAIFRTGVQNVRQLATSSVFAELKTADTAPSAYESIPQAARLLPSSDSTHSISLNAFAVSANSRQSQGVTLHGNGGGCVDLHHFEF